MSSTDDCKFPCHLFGDTEQLRRVILHWRSASDDCSCDGCMIMWKFCRPIAPGTDASRPSTSSSVRLRSDSFINDGSENRSSSDSGLSMPVKFTRLGDATTGKVNTTIVDQLPGASSASASPESSLLAPHGAVPSDSEESLSLAVKRMRTDLGEESTTTQCTLVERPFDAAILGQQLIPLWKQLCSSPYSAPFRQPAKAKPAKKRQSKRNTVASVRAVLTPIDLATIGDKLEEGRYGNAWEFCDDVWRLLENALTAHSEKSVAYENAFRLRDEFSMAIDPIMRRFGYCCGQKRRFTLTQLICYGSSNCRIAAGQEYYCYTDEDEAATFSCICLCSTHYGNIHTRKINIGGAGNGTLVNKTAFKPMRNDAVVMEPMDECQICNRHWHRICAMHFEGLYVGGFVCNLCRRTYNIERPTFRFTAENLPHCELSLHIETRLNQFYEDVIAGDEFKDVREAPRVFVRVLNCSEHSAAVNVLMKERYALLGYPESFPYREKSVFVFQLIDGAEVCLYGFFVQEYGSDCPEPNRGRAYISYLGSAKFFRPAALRTPTYHEVLLGYLDYVRGIGYTTVHITACPPQDGDDYVFYCPPPDQLIPEQDRLLRWYERMLTKGRAEGFVTGYMNLYRQSKADNISSPMQLPYLEGDLWPEIFDKCILEAEEEYRKLSAKNDAGSGKGKRGRPRGMLDLDAFDLTNPTDMRSALQKRSRLPPVPMNEKLSELIREKLYIVLKEQRNFCLVIRLKPTNDLYGQPIVDPDPLTTSNSMNSREEFCSRSHANRWEFSTLRRAKWSTKWLTFTLHREEDPYSIGFICDVCGAKAAVFCSTCETDLCFKCVTSPRHPHPVKDVTDYEQ